MQQALCILFCATFLLNAQSGKRVPQSAFDVIGIAARTTNIDEAGPNGVIPRMWQRLFSQNLLDQIPDKTDAGILAVYTEYASDEKGAYTYLLGAKVKPGTVAPEGMRSVHIPAGPYVVFQTARGPVQKVIPAAWQVIWSAFPQDGPAHRSFQADFELYPAGFDPKNAGIGIYIGVGK
jgi:predicted transcriptional regulator YdeE